MYEYVITFTAEPHDDEVDDEPGGDLVVTSVTVTSRVAPEDVAAGDRDAHELVTARARRRAILARQWEATHITLPDGELVTALAGL